MTDTSDPSPTVRKAALRTQALARRDALELDDRMEWDQELAQRALPVLLKIIDQATAGTIVSAYWPMRSEADPRPILEALHEQGVTLALPALVDGRMIFRRWAPYEPIVPGGFGTLVPEPIQPEVEPTILLVPLLAFDRRGFRIGYGKGHYDMALSKGRPVVSIGLAYAAQETERVPEEPHDQRLDWIVTEREALSCG